MRRLIAGDHNECYTFSLTTTRHHTTLTPRHRHPLSTPRRTHSPTRIVRVLCTPRMYE